MSKLPNYCNCLFLISGRLGRGGVVWSWLYLINSLQKNRQQPSCIVKFLQLYSFDSGYSLFVLGKDFWVGRELRSDIIKKKSPKHSFQCFTTIKLLDISIFEQIFLWAQAYNNNILLWAAIRYKNKICVAKKLGIEGKRGRVQTRRWPYIWEDTEIRVVSHTPGLHPLKCNGKNKIGSWRSIYKDYFEPKFGWI